MTEPMIELDRITKQYPGSAEPAVDQLSMTINRGEIVVFLGPSGCGKTTTMKMINRLIEPTSGRIIIDGEDVTDLNPDKLRRRIGYAIQQTGLFPHLTVSENVAAVPKLLGWPADKIRQRVDHLLDLTGLDPGVYRDRYPKQLSGGQQQRVGVARALGADPPVLLMDEPFGAIDPITREGLQNEFLALQRTLRKTIVFVTHDIDEAVKMGNRIAVFDTGAKIAQFDTPQTVLSEPASDFVADFVGSGAALRRLTLTQIGDVPVADWPTIGADEIPRAPGALRSLDEEYVLVLADDRPVGWVPTSRTGAMPPARETQPLQVPPLRPDNTLFDALDQMLVGKTSLAVVVNDDGGFRGVLDLDAVRDRISGSNGEDPGR